MTTVFISHPLSTQHETPHGHPERVARIERILDEIDKPEFAELVRVVARRGTAQQVALAHPAAYHDQIAAKAPHAGMTSLDADTWMSPSSYEAAITAVGGMCQAVDMVMTQEAQNAFVAMRPPGHHAEAQTPMGFCLFGTVAIGAKYALSKYDLSRVAIVDFDVHHGNGTQDLVWNDPRILFASSHQMPCYPGTGSPSEKGAHDNVINVALPPESDGSYFLEAFDRLIAPRLDAFAPEMIFISAGFDAHYRDPLAQLNWENHDFAEVTARLMALAEKHASGRIVSTLEGGYDLEGLAGGLSAHIHELMGQDE